MKWHTHCILIWANWASSPISSIWRRTSRVIAWRTWSIIFWVSGSFCRLCAATCAHTAIAVLIRRISGALFRLRSMERTGYRLLRDSVWRTLCELGRIRQASLFCTSNRIVKPVRSSLRRCALYLSQIDLHRRISSSLYLVSSTTNYLSITECVYDDINHRYSFNETREKGRYVALRINYIGCFCVYFNLSATDPPINLESIFS